MAQAKIRVLLVEDNTINRTFLRMFLERKGYAVEEACNGYEALKLLSEQDFNLVFMDVQMPGMDGVETTRRIRADNFKTYDSGIPIIAMTAHSMKGDRELLLKSGMDDYAAKPVDLEQLVLLVERWAFCEGEDGARVRADTASQHNAYEG